MTKKIVPIRLERQLSDEDEIILVAPLWAGDVAVEAHSFIEKHDKAAIRMVVLSKSSELKNQERFRSVHMVRESKSYDREQLKTIVKTFY